VDLPPRRWGSKPNRGCDDSHLANFLERRKAEVQLRRISLLDSWLNKGGKKGRSCLEIPTPETGRNFLSVGRRVAVRGPWKPTRGERCALGCFCATSQTP